MSPHVDSDADSNFSANTNSDTAAAREVRVTASSRLHFGLFSFGGEGVQFGGAGVMIARPITRLRAVPSDNFSAWGPAAERVAAFAAEWMAYQREKASRRDWAASLAPELPAVRLDIESVAPSHVGLGSGTQLALAVAACLELLCGGGELPGPDELAASVGRGRRSAIGTYGFCRGGLLVDDGKAESVRLATLAARVALPAEWRFVLVRPGTGVGLHGPDEIRAFQTLPPVSRETSDELRRQVRERLLPAARAADYDQFCAALYQFGHDAGMCFAAAQGGPYNGPVLSRLVARMRELGMHGVGQSSWGPTLFAVAADERQAEEWVGRLEAESTDAPLEVCVAAPDNQGASVWRSWA